MIDKLHAIEQDAQRQSTVHALDARVKIVVCFVVIIAVVSFPYITAVYWLGVIISIFFCVLWALSCLSPVTYLKRLLITLPFGLFIIIFQIFFKNPYYTEFTPITDLPFGIQIYAESVEFATILLVKFILCISFIILLSSTTPIQELLKGGRRLGLPAVMALSLGMMVRYLYVFAGMFESANAALASRHFHAFDRNLSYRYRLETLGYMIGMMFIRSYEQGERTYTAMLCRGYGKAAFDNLPAKPLKKTELAILAAGLLFVSAATFTVWFISQNF